MRIFDFLFGPPDIENLKAKKDVEGLLKALKYKKDNNVREKAAMALGDMGDERSVKPLIYALNDEDADIRENAAAALEAIFRLPDVENLKAKKDVEGLIRVLKYKEKDNDVRENAAAAIRELQYTKAAGPLIQVLETEEGAVREKAAVALGEIGDERAVGPLTHALKYKSIGNVEMVKEILKQEEQIFACPYCKGSGSVRGWRPNPKGSIAYTATKHRCSRCEGTGKLKSIVEGKLKIEVTKLPFVPVFTIKEELDIFHIGGGPANVRTVTLFNWGEINMERANNFGKMSGILDKQHQSNKHSAFMFQKNAKPRIGFDILLSEPDVQW